MKKILVIGGSYFAGRVFVEELASAGGYDIHIMNRGNIPVRIEGVNSIVCDRHDAESIARSLPDTAWDVVVDFCAYAADDISLFLDKRPGGGIGRYILISTATVYAETVRLPVDESSPVITGPQPGLGQMADYACSKVRAEDELRRRTGRDGGPAAYTVIRPAFIFGKYNYAPRESFFFDLLHEGKEIPLPVNDLPLFSFVSVWDLARLILNCCGSETAENMVLNAAAPELISYKRLAAELDELEPEKFRTRKVSREEIISENIPLPFPLDEHLVYNGTLATELLDFRYSPFSEEFKRTYKYYKAGKGWA